MSNCTHSESIKNPFAECNSEQGEPCAKTKYPFQETFEECGNKEAAVMSGAPQLGRAGVTDAGLKYERK
jgi:hypothetical protein